MIDTDYKYAQWSMNVNPYGMHWQTYHNGCWYDKTVMSYDEAVEQIIKPEVIAKVMKDHPHLTAFDLNNNQVIQTNNISQDPVAPYEYFDRKKEIEAGKLISQSDDKLKWINHKDAPRSGTIEERNNYHSPDIEAIKKEIQSYRYGVKALKSIYGEMVKDSPELKKVFDEKVEELEQKKSIV